MRDKALLGLMVLLAGMGVLVDFTSAILSLIGDLLLMGAAVACAVFVYRHQQERIEVLKAQNQALVQQAKSVDAVSSADWQMIQDARGPQRESMFGRNRGGWRHE